MAHDSYIFIKKILNIEHINGFHFSSRYSCGNNPKIPIGIYIIKTEFNYIRNRYAYW